MVYNLHIYRTQNEERKPQYVTYTGMTTVGEYQKHTT